MAEKTTSPWIRGIIDTLVGAEIIRRSQIPNRNRLSVILIDSAFETGCRAFLKHEAKMKLQDAHRNRETLVKTVRAKLSSIDDQVWDSVGFYYEDIRCDFYHESAGKTIADVTLLDYRETVEFIINNAFSIQIAPMIEAELQRLSRKETSAKSSEGEKHQLLRLPEVDGPVNKVLLAVDDIQPTSVDEVNEYFKRAGDTLRLKQKDFTSIVARNSGSKKYFYYDRADKRWILSGLGRFKLSQLGGAATYVK